VAAGEGASLTDAIRKPGGAGRAFGCLRAERGKGRGEGERERGEGKGRGEEGREGERGRERGRGEGKGRGEGERGRGEGMHQDMQEPMPSMWCGCALARKHSVIKRTIALLCYDSTHLLFPECGVWWGGPPPSISTALICFSVIWAL